MSAIDDIAAERTRQIEKEGWSPEHDDGHEDGELAMAAALYAAAPRNLLEVVTCGYCGTAETKDPWPWWNEDKSGRSRWHAWDKRELHDQRRRLVIAGALIAAEIERLDRA